MLKRGGSFVTACSAVWVLELSMGDYPTAYRGSRSRSSSAGFPSGSTATAATGAALAGFLSPGAAKALQGLGPQVAEAAAEAVTAAGELLPEAAAEALSSPVASTAARGLFGLAARALPWLALALAAYELYEWIQTSRSTSGFSLVARCPNPAHGGPNFNYTGSNGPYSSIQVSQVTNCTDGQGDHTEFVVTPVVSWYITSHRYQNPTFGWWRHQMLELWSRTGSAQPARYMPAADFLADFISPASGAGEDDPPLEFMPYLDPLVPPGKLPALRPPLPYRFLPYRQPNPWRDPREQSERGGGGEAPASRPGAVVEFGVSPVEVPARRGVTAPGEFQPPWQWPSAPPGTAPGGVPGQEPGQNPGRAPGPGPGHAEPDPGGVPGPGVSPVQEPPSSSGRPVDEAGPPVRVEVPEGSFGPTITIGGGPPIGPHMRQPPKKREKERKARYINPGSMFLLRKVANPLTESLEVLDCLYKSLPKRVRWKAQQSSWRRQQRYAREHGYKLGHKPNPIQRNDWGQPSIPVPFLPGDQSISVPGGQPRFVDVDLTKHYYTGMSPQEKALAVYRNAHLLDLPSAVSCWAANEVEDRIFGGIGRLSAKGARRIRRPVGLQTGPLF